MLGVSPTIENPYFKEHLLARARAPAARLQSSSLLRCSVNSRPGGRTQSHAPPRPLPQAALQGSRGVIFGDLEGGALEPQPGFPNGKISRSLARRRPRSSPSPRRRQEAPLRAPSLRRFALGGLLFPVVRPVKRPRAPPLPACVHGRWRRTCSWRRSEGTKGTCGTCWAGGGGGSSRACPDGRRRGRSRGRRTTTRSSPERGSEARDAAAARSGRVAWGVRRAAATARAAARRQPSAQDGRGVGAAGRRRRRSSVVVLFACMWRGASSSSRRRGGQAASPGGGRWSAIAGTQRLSGRRCPPIRGR